MLPMVHTEPVLFNFGGPNVDGASTPSASVPPSLTPQSDVDELVNIFFDVDVAVDTFTRIDSCELQLGDTWRGMQGKMSVTAPVKKIRKKSDSKPQSQINKCNNEKRRRELENETINQLEELLGTCLAEVKQPDKNGIVREATRQIEEVLNRRRECPGECPRRRSPVQAGEVSSTQPPSHLHYSEATTLIEALKYYTSSLGWVLLEINSKGEIVCVTENIKDFILRDRTELHKKSIFSLLHVRDHAKLRPLLNIQSFGWAAGDNVKFQAIQVRLAIDNFNGTEDTDYVEVVIHAAPVRGSPEQAGSVMCVIRRCEDASAALLPAPPLPLDSGPPVPAPMPAPAPASASAHVDQIVFRLDCNFIILNCDLSGLEHLVGTRYLELIESGDRVRIAAHLKSAPGLTAPPAISEPFRLRLGDKPLRVIAQTRLFRAEASSGERDIIMSTHTVLDDDEPGAAPRPPLNGDVAYRASMSPADLISLNDFDIEPWTVSNFNMPESGDESKDTKDTGSEGPGTPRTPATPGDPPPPGPGPVDERLRSLLTKPAAADGGNSNNRLLKVLLKQEDEEATSSETSAPHTPAAALSPLHAPLARAPPHPPPHPPPPHAPHNPLAAHNAHPSHSLPPVSMHSMQQPMHHNNSDILSRILHSDEDAEESRRNQDNNRGPAQQSALLTQLLSSNNGPSNNGRAQDDRDHYYQGTKRKFEESKGCSTSTVNKRATPEIQQQVSSSAAPSVTACSSATSPSTSTGMSPLCAKNQILVSLLARQQTSPTTPLPLPNPSLRPFAPAARPRPPPPPRHLASVANLLSTHNRPNNVNGGTTSSMECAPMQSVQSHLQLMLQGGRGAYPPAPAPAPAPNPPPSPLHYPGAAPLHQYNQQGARAQGDGEVPVQDKDLSDILDEVIESLPDAERSAADVSVLLDLENYRLKHDFAGAKEKNAINAINAIRQSLMQYETGTESPASTSPAPPPVYSVQNMGPVSMSGGSGALYSMSGSGMEPARARSVEQQRARLLDMQRTQHLVVSRKAAEQPQADLGSTINALVSATPPNVALQRTADYHHYIHPSNQMGSNYGTNKITSTQQNPMLSRQLSGSGGAGGAGGYALGAHAAHGAHAPAALHTPLTQRAPYHRAPRPHLVGGYYDEGNAGGYCAEYAPARRPPHAPHAAHQPHPAHPAHPAHPSPIDHGLSCAGNSGVAGAGAGAASGAGAGGAAGGTSEYVRNELRAVVGARAARPDLHPLNPDLDQLMTFDMSTSTGGGSVGGAPAAAAWDARQTTSSTTEAGSAEAAAAAGAGAAAGGDEAPAGGRAAAPAPTKASLLQKLLSQ